MCLGGILGYSSLVCQSLEADQSLVLGRSLRRARSPPVAAVESGARTDGDEEAEATGKSGRGRGVETASHQLRTRDL